MLSALLLCVLQSLLQGPAPTAEAPRALDWNDFPVFVWREAYAGKPLPEELVAPFGGVVLMREEDSSWARERGLAYLIWNVAGRDALHLDADEAWQKRVEDWIRTQDPNLLVREPCLNDPKTVKTLFETLDATIAKHGEHPGLGFVLGDEVGLTPNGDPFDLCRCELCEAKWKEYARRRGLPERAPLTDEVRLALLDDDFSLLGAWLARRRFDELQLWQQLEILAGRLRARSSSVPVGLLGLGSASLGGLRFEDILPRLSFVECYPVLETRERLADARGEEASLATLFLASESENGAAWVMWEHWMNGGNGLVLWSDSELQIRPRHLQRLTETAKAIRAIEKRFPDLQPPSRMNVTLVRDEDSIAVGWLQDALLDGPTWPRRTSNYQVKNGTRERLVNAWLRLLEDCGVAVGVSNFSSIDWERETGILILAELLVVDDEEVRGLEVFLDKGGMLVIDGDLGWVDRSGHPRRSDLFDRLHARFPGAVLRAPSGMSAYANERTNEKSALRFRAFVSKLVEPKERGLRVGSASVPWLTRWRHTERANCFTWSAPRLVCLLPHVPTPEERTDSLRPIELEVSAAPGFEIEWVYPREGRQLQAGDAAVFLLRARP